MIYFLRNISIRLWISVILGITLTFAMFPSIQNFLPNINAPITCAVITGFIFILAGYLMDIAAVRTLYHHINDAKHWEIDGIFNKSEACYLKAVEIFDSYMLTILTSKKIASHLTGAISKFALNSGWNNNRFNRAIYFFLQKNPHETEVAYLWLKEMIKREYPSSFSDLEENIFTFIAETEPINPKLVPLLAQIFKKTKRADFAAKKIFSIMGENRSECFENIEEPADTAVVMNENIMTNPHTEIEKNTENIKNPHIETQKNIEIEKNKDKETETSILSNHPFSTKRRIAQSRRKSKYYFTTKFFSKSSSPTQSILYVIKRGLIKFLSLTMQGIILLSSLPMSILSLLLKVIKYFIEIIIRVLKKIHYDFKKYTNFRKNIKYMLLVAVSISVILLFINTVAHLFRTPALPVKPQTVKTEVENQDIQVISEKKFTIQAAAYLVKKHAEKYLSNLEKKGVSDGFITDVQGGGRTWYLIRVGHYESKEAANEYGNKLKASGAIDDFFVDNSGS